MALTRPRPFRQALSRNWTRSSKASASATARLVADLDPSPEDEATNVRKLARRYGCTTEAAAKVPPILARKILADLDAAPGRPERQARKPPRTLEDWEAFVEDAESSIAMCDEVPMEGGDFADSVRAKLEGMAEWARENERVTDAMQTALDNMTGGLSSWVE